ncbi:MAG: magnesium transporter [Clostridia bacterium]|nr:magnesium transporter [Clostridia bacterium]
MEEKNKKTEDIVSMLTARDFASLRRALCDENPADIAELFEEVAKEQYPLVFRLLPKELAAEVFVEMDSDVQKIVIGAFSDYELQQVLDELYLDDTVDLIEEMPANVVSRILRNCSPADRQMINQLLRYPKDSAGSIMTTEYVNLKQDMTVEDAFSLIRRDAIDKETIYTCYVTAPNRKLIGIVSAKTLMISPLDKKIGDIMEQNVISVNTQTDKEEVGFLFGKYSFLALPVVDTEGRMLGIITFDDAMDVISEETEEDFAVMAAITPSEGDASYLKTSAFSVFKARIPWLLLLTLSATFTGLIISSFEASLSACVVLTAFIPMLMGTGGNCGSQSSVTVIRGLSLGEIEFHDIFTVLWKELRVSLLCAAVLAAMTFVKIFLVDYLLLHVLEPAEMLTVPLTVCLTMCVTVVSAKLIGCALPILVKKLGLDPAVMASPFITTIIDALSLAVYFAFAVWLIPGIS